MDDKQQSRLDEIKEQLLTEETSRLRAQLIVDINHQLGKKTPDWVTDRARQVLPQDGF